MLINFNHLKTFYNALVQRIKSFRGNWNQNDPTADDYIKNRPFYSEGVQEVEVFPSCTLELYAGYNGGILSSAFVEGQIYRVIWNNVEYECRAKNDGEGGIYIGNQAIVGWEFPESITSNEPFFMYTYQEDGFLDNFIYPSKYGIYTISIAALQEVVHKLDKKFIDVDMPDNVITEDSLFPILEDSLAPVTFTNDYDSLSGKPSVVQYAAQTLTDDQKAQARANIGAGTRDYNDLINVPRVNFWEDDSDNATSIPGIIRQKSLPDGYPYVTYTTGELVNGRTTGTLTVIKNDSGTLSINMSVRPSFGSDTFVHGAKYLLVIGEASYVATCDKSGLGYEPCTVRIDGTNWSLFDNYNGTLQLRLSDWAQLNLLEGTHEWGIYNAIPTYRPIAEKYLPDAVANKSYITWTNILDKPEYSIILKDVDTSYRYNVFVKNGTLATSMACASIRVDSIPDKEYLEGDILDLSEAVVTAVYEDGSERQVTNFTYPASVPRVSSPEITICYVEFDRDLTATVVLPSIKVLSETLVDFEYTIEDDGTYTLTAWKGTLNGEPSTEMIIPANRLINL